MVYSFLKIALRNILKKKVFSIINIVGLALGIGAFIIIFRYVAFELSFEDFHADKEQVYAMHMTKTTDKGTDIYSTFPSAIKNSLAEVPEIRSVARFVNISYQNYSVIFDNNNDVNSFEETGVYYADKSFEDIFSFPLTKGSFNKFDEPWTVVIASELSKKLFGNLNPIGKTISLSSNVGKNDFEVIGILDEFPKNTHYDFNVLISFPTIKLIEGEESFNSWTRWNSMIYFKTSNSIKARSLDEKVSNQLLALDIFNKSSRVQSQDKSVSTEGKWEVTTTNILDIHFSSFEDSILQNKGNKSIVIILSVIGFFILVIAWINYINLSTVRAMERAKEVGVRKVLGATLAQLRTQFLAESLVMNGAATVLAFLIVQNTLPLIKEFTNPMIISENQQLFFWIIIFGIILIGAILSGLYPAFILSSYQPTDIINGKVKKKIGGEYLRKALVVFQYSASILLIGGALTINKQISFMMNHDLGLDLDQILIVQSPPGIVQGDNTAFYEAVASFKENIKQNPEVSSVTASSAVPGEKIGWATNGIKRISDDNKETTTYSLIASDQYFFETYDLQLLTGRFLNEKDNPWSTGEVVINEAAAHKLGFENAGDALDAKLTGGNIFGNNLVVKGIVKNHNHISLKNEIDPIIYVNSIWSNYYSIELNIDKSLPIDEQVISLNNAINKIEASWSKFFPYVNFEYHFADDAFNAQYRNDRSFRWIIGLFTILAIIIASLGLLGLSSYNLIQRSKEISIRKVLGANVITLISMLSRDYIILISLAGIIAAPLTWYLLDIWLNNYAFRIEINWLIILLPVALIITIAASTIGIQIFKSAKNNPAKSLRNN